MPTACTYCIVTKGLKGSDIGEPGKTFETDEEFFDHLEMEHDFWWSRGRARPGSRPRPGWRRRTRV